MIMKRVPRLSMRFCPAIGLEMVHPYLSMLIWTYMTYARIAERLLAGLGWFWFPC
jgi:hypothetical protein